MVVPQGVENRPVHVRPHTAFIPWTAGQFAKLTDLLPHGEGEPSHDDIRGARVREAIQRGVTEFKMRS